MSTTRERVERGDKLLTLSGVAKLLNMKRPNVARFLARHDVDHAMAKETGYWWWEEDILQLKEKREKDPAKMRADEKRRRAALAKLNADTDGIPQRLGKTQQALLMTMLRHPVTADTSSKRHSMQRLAERGFVELVPGETRVYQLTADGKRVAAELKP